MHLCIQIRRWHVSHIGLRILKTRFNTLQKRIRRVPRIFCSSLELKNFNQKPTVKATSHLTIFDIPMRLVRQDQRHRRRFTR